LGRTAKTLNGATAGLSALPQFELALMNGKIGYADN
jgi:hypothetical protein